MASNCLAADRDATSAARPAKTAEAKRAWLISGERPRTAMICW